MGTLWVRSTMNVDGRSKWPSSVARNPLANSAGLALLALSGSSTTRRLLRQSLFSISTVFSCRDCTCFLQDLKLPGVGVNHVLHLRDARFHSGNWKQNISMSCLMRLTSVVTVLILDVKVSFSEVIVASRSVEEGSASPMSANAA